MALCGLAFSPRAAHAAVGDYGTLEDGTYVISSYYASTQGYSRSWDILDGGKSDGTKVISYSTHSAGNQRWRITTDSDGYSTIVNAQSGKALDVPWATAANGTQLQVYKNHGGIGQKWKIVERSTGYKVVSAIDESYVIDLSWVSTDNGAAIQLYQDHGGLGQRWTFERCAEDALNVSDEQTELFDTSVYLTDAQPSEPVFEYVPSGWSVGKLSGIWGDNGVYYSGGDYWTSGDAVIKVRYDKIGKVNGEWVSCRLTFENLRGNGITRWPGSWVLPNGKEGSGLSFYNSFWGGITYFGLYQVDCTMEMFNTETGEQIDLTGSYTSFGSLNGETNDMEGVRYVGDADYSSYVLETNNLKQEEDGTWRGVSEDGFTDGIGNPGANKNAVSFRIADAAPEFRFSVDGGTNAQWVTLNFSPMTAAIPPSPTKSVEITG